MDVILYSTGCPNCKTLELMLEQKGVNYTIVSDIGIMDEKGFNSVPQLEVDGTVCNYKEAKKWIGER